MFLLTSSKSNSTTIMTSLFVFDISKQIAVQNPRTAKYIPKQHDVDEASGDTDEG